MENQKMVVSSISMFAIFACIIDIHSFNLASANFHLSTGVDMIEKFKHQFEKLKTLSIYYTTLMVATIAYWIGVSLSFLLWKISNLKKKENEGTFWVEVEETEEDYKSQY
jgi:predicted membrane channel-forming protein YqfA (hemolysin III family)